MPIKPNIVLIFPYRFLKNTYQRLEIEKYEKYCNVKILDLGNIISPEFSKPITDIGIKGQNIKFLDTTQELIIELNKLDSYDLILNQVGYDNLKGFLINVLIKRSKPRVVSFMNSGHALNKNNNIFYSLLGLMARRLCYFFIAPEYMLMAGRDYIQRGQKYLPSKTKILGGHSWEWSLSLIHI